MGSVGDKINGLGGRQFEELEVGGLGVRGGHEIFPGRQSVALLIYGLRVPCLGVGPRIYHDPQGRSQGPRCPAVRQRTISSKLLISLYVTPSLPLLLYTSLRLAVS